MQDSPTNHDSGHINRVELDPVTPSPTPRSRVTPGSSLKRTSSDSPSLDMTDIVRPTNRSKGSRPSGISAMSEIASAMAALANAFKPAEPALIETASPLMRAIESFLQEFGEDDLEICETP